MTWEEQGPRCIVCVNLMAAPEVGLAEGEETVPSVPPCAISALGD